VFDRTNTRSPRRDEKTRRRQVMRSKAQRKPRSRPATTEQLNSSLDAYMSK